ncbi:MAG TPA: class I SAM-dependent methyltransferase [Candidatus Angelobacter sp.]|jgi:SAM-dependent methyltransferase
MNQNSIQYDRALFAGTAQYYSRFRFPYPRALFDYLKQTFSFDGTGAALDLGCGPGLLTIPLAASFKKIVAMDPDDEMLAEARKAAIIAGVSNVEFVKGSSWELPPAIPTPISQNRAAWGPRTIGNFRFVIMGQSFHWMDRDQALNALFDLLEPKGVLAIVYQKRKTPPAIKNAEDETVKSFLGERRRAGEGYYEHPLDNHEVVLARSRFTMLPAWHYSYERTQTIDEAVGFVFSTSRATKQLLGDSAAEFETELRKQFLLAAPAGLFRLSVDVTALLGRKE